MKIKKKLKLDHGMLGFAAFFFLMTGVMTYVIVVGGIPVFWTQAGATLFQSLGLGVTCLWGSWSIGKRVSYEDET